MPLILRNETLPRLDNLRRVPLVETALQCTMIGVVNLHLIYMCLARAAYLLYMSSLFSKENDRSNLSDQFKITATTLGSNIGSIIPNLILSLGFRHGKRDLDLLEWFQNSQQLVIPNLDQQTLPISFS